MKGLTMKELNIGDKDSFHGNNKPFSFLANRITYGTQ